MNEFTASNGYKVTPNGDGANVYRGIMSTPIYPDEMQALHEFFQAESDKRAGRWRDPEQPEFIVYGPYEPDEIGYDLVVIDEHTGERKQYLRSDDEGGGSSFEHPWSNKPAWAARHWFAAHPQSKPDWHSAAEGEVWVLDVGAGPFPMICQADAFRDHGGSFPLDHRDIKSAHRIYPPQEQKA